MYRLSVYFTDNFSYPSCTYDLVLQLRYGAVSKNLINFLGAGKNEKNSKMEQFKGRKICLNG